jgi:hypothetical protein
MRMIRKIDLQVLQKNHPKLYKLERTTSELFNPGTSVTRLFLYKIRVGIEFIYLSLIQLHHLKNLKLLRSLSQTKASREALLIANGPSAAMLDKDVIKDLQVKESLDIIGMNFCTDFCKKNGLLPDYIVLSDPYFINEPSDERVVQLLNWISENETVVLFLPMHWKPLFHNNFMGKNQILYFNDLSLRGWTRNVNPLKPRGYTSLTAYKSLAILSFLGYKKINIIGIDNSFYLKLTVDQQNTLWQESVHSSNNYHEKSNFSKDFPRGAADYFYSISTCFLDLQQFKSLPIVNLDLNSITDVFKKESSPMIGNTLRRNF